MEQAMDPDFIQQALVPMESETHAGEDVGIYSIGPWSHLFQKNGARSPTSSTSWTTPPRSASER